MSLTATDPFTRHIKSLTLRKQALVTIETRRIGAAECKSLGNSVFSPEALPSGGPNTPLQEACRVCPAFLRATSGECSREVTLDVLPVHSQHLAPGLALSCLWSQRSVEVMAGDFSPRNSFVSRLCPPTADAGACPGLGNRHPGLQQPPALPSPPFGSPLSFFPISEVCVLLQIISFYEQHSHRPKQSLSGKRFTWRCETVSMIIVFKNKKSTTHTQYLDIARRAELASRDLGCKVFHPN